jgi:hypothetical protein
MRRWFEAVVVGGVMLAAGPVAAQTPAGAPASAPIVNMGYVGANIGTAVVENFSGVFALEGGVRVWKNLDVVGELVWMGDAVTRRQLDRAEQISTYLGTIQNAPATGSIKVPLFYGGVGARWVFESSGRFRPYIIATVGGAHTELKPAFTLAGTDVTSSITQYGITLGQDVIGKYNHAAATGGIGILVKFKDSWYVDGGARLTSVADEGQRVNVARLVIGGGYRF